MAPRRTHTKSRNGCDYCKKRRVKCDEGGPPCANCISRDAQCHYSGVALLRHSYPDMPSSSNLQSSGSSGSQSGLLDSTVALRRIHTGANQGPSASTSTGNIPYSPSTRLRELELMHYWCMKTSLGFTLEFASIFQGHVVKEAFTHGYLMESILALTSLHIASEMSDPVSAGPYVGAALQYQNNAALAFRTALLNITPSNCDAVFASSVLMMACNVVSPLLPTGDNDKAKVSTDNILLLFDLFKGISSIVRRSRHWLESGPFKGIINLKHSVVLGNDETIPSINRLRDLNDMVTGTANSPLYEVYRHAIEQLRNFFIKSKMLAVAWLVGVDKEFTNELGKGEPMALMIFLHWCVLLDQVDELWWTKYSGKRLVEELSGCLFGHGKEWDEAIEWAKIQVGL